MFYLLLSCVLIMQCPTRQDTCGRTGCQPLAAVHNSRTTSPNCLHPLPLLAVLTLPMSTFTVVVAVAVAAAAVATVSILPPWARDSVAILPVSATNLMPVVILAWLSPIPHLLLQPPRLLLLLLGIRLGERGWKFFLYSSPSTYRCNYFYCHFQVLIHLLCLIFINLCTVVYLSMFSLQHIYCWLMALNVWRAWAWGCMTRQPCLAFSFPDYNIMTTAAFTRQHFHREMA